MARKEIGEERREQILAAFEACVIRDGLAQTTLQKIANEAGLPRSLVRYFIGNRDDMIPLLINRMTERAEQDLLNLRSRNRSTTTYDLIDFMFDGAFADDTSNQIVGTLWNLAKSDEQVRQRLIVMYDHVLIALTKQMAFDGIGANVTERRSISYAIMSLAYGNASFILLSQNIDQHENCKSLAHKMVADLQSKTDTEK